MVDDSLDETLGIIAGEREVCKDVGGGGGGGEDAGMTGATSELAEPGVFEGGG